MELSELRIGNYYKLKKGALGGGICKIENIKDFAYISDLINGKSVRPIPITENILFKMGYTFTDGITYFLNKETPIIYLIKKGNKIKIYKKIATIESKIKYVHQLQNLYFALTGVELTFSLMDNNIDLF